MMILNTKSVPFDCNLGASEFERGTRSEKRLPQELFGYSRDLMRVFFKKFDSARKWQFLHT